MLAAMASAGDESPGGDGTMSGDGLRAPLETGAREPTPLANTVGQHRGPTPWANTVGQHRGPTPWATAIGRDERRASLETGMRVCADRIELGANDSRTWRERAIDGGGLSAGTEPGETHPRT